LQIISQFDGLEQFRLRPDGTVEGIAKPDEFESELLLSANLRSAPNLVKLFTKAADVKARVYIIFDQESEPGEERFMIITQNRDRLKIQDA
jgi:hypothetical protein